MRQLSNWRLSLRAFRQMFGMLRWAARHWLAGTRFMLGIATERDRKITGPWRSKFDWMKDTAGKGLKVGGDFTWNELVNVMNEVEDAGDG